MAEKFISINSKIKIEVIRELAYVDKTSDLVSDATKVIGTGDFLRVNTLKPISYKFEIGMNEVPEPYTFIDPVTRKEVSESILTWPTVKRYIETGKFKVYNARPDIEEVSTKTERVAKANVPKPKKSEMDKIAEEITNE